MSAKQISILVVTIAVIAAAWNITTQKAPQTEVERGLLYPLLLGVALCFLPEGDTFLDVLVAVPGLFLVLAWCIYDATERGHRIGFLMRIALVLILAVALPIAGPGLGVLAYFMWHVAGWVIEWIDHIFE